MVRLLVVCFVLCSQVTNNGHDKSELFNTGSQFSKTESERLFRRMIFEGVLQENLQLTSHDTMVSYLYPGPRSRDVMAGKYQVMFHRQCENAQAKSKKQIDSAQRSFQQRCYVALDNLRKEIAVENSLNPQTVFTAQTLDHLAQRLPTTIEELRKVEGVVHNKVRKYGERFLQLMVKLRSEQPGSASGRSKYFNDAQPSSSSAGTNGANGAATSSDFFEDCFDAECDDSEVDESADWALDPYPRQKSCFSSEMPKGWGSAPVSSGGGGGRGRGRGKFGRFSNFRKKVGKRKFTGSSRAVTGQRMSSRPPTWQRRR